MIPVAWEGTQFVHHSLAHVNRELCLRLAEYSQLELTLIPYEPDRFDPALIPRYKPLRKRLNRPLSRPAAVHVRHQWPPNFEPPPSGAWVMIQPWEFGGLPVSWVAPMRDLVDEIWVPSAFVREAYVRSGVASDKVVVVPNGVELGLYTPKGPRHPLQTTRRCKLLYVGGMLVRKGVDILLDVYASTFTAADDVCLVIKAAGIGTFYGDSPFVQQIRETMARPSAPEIELLTDELSDVQMAALYRACDALVHPYRGEGFGMPIVEAMSSGLPVIVTDYGACLDFCDAGNAFLIPAREERIDSHALPPPSIGYWWAEPDRLVLAEHMRRVVADPRQARELGQRARQRMREFTWERAAARALERIQVLAARQPVRDVAVRGFTGGAVVPLPLQGRRRIAFLHHPQWSSDNWQEVVRAYLRAFTDQDDTTLVLWLDPNQGVSAENAQHRIMDVIAATLDDPDGGPDLLLVPDRLDLRGISRLYAAVDYVVPNGDVLQAQRARQSGVRVLDDLTVQAWRAAAQENSPSR